MTRRAEQESTIRWDQEEKVAYFDTNYPPVARYWESQGLDVQVADRAPDGKPRAWTATGPKDVVRVRRVKDGQVVKRADHGKGCRFQPQQPDQLVESEDHELVLVGVRVPEA